MSGLSLRAMTATKSELVGRATEVARLDQAVRDAAHGSATFVLLRGEAGIGKTSLLDAAARRGAQAGLQSLRGVAIESGAAIPYLPLVAPLAACVRAAGDDPASRIVRRALGGDVPRPDATTPLDGGRLVEAIFDLLTRHGTALLVDDVHWADASTITVLDYVAQRATNAPLLVVAAARDDEPDLIERLPIADGRRYAQLPVGRLTLDEVGQQVEALLGRAPDRDRVKRIHLRTAGNPFFVEQVVTEEARPATESTGETPIALRSLINRRVGRISSPARRFVETLALTGCPTSSELLTAVTGLEPDALDQAADEGRRAGVVVADDTGFRLRHPLFGEVIASGITGSRRREIHASVAETLVRLGGDVAAIAGHWWESGDRARAWSVSRAAAAAATAASAFAEARIHLERAIAVWPATEPGRTEAVLDAARAAWFTGDARAALELARRADADEADSIRVVVARASYAWDAGERAEAIAVFERATRLLETSTTPSVRGRVLWGIGRARVATGRPAEALELALAAAEQARLAGNQEQESEAWSLAAMSRAFGDSLDGVAELERAVDLALGARAGWCTGQAYQFLVDLRALAGQPRRALEDAVVGIEASERLGLARFHGSDLRGRAALLLLELGRWDEAEALLARADPRAFPELARALLAMRRGDASAAEVALAAAVRGGSIGGPGALGGWLELARVELAWLAGDRAGAVRELGTVPAVPGVWGRDVRAWSARWAVRLSSPGAASGTAVADVRRHPDHAIAVALEREITAQAMPVDETRAAERWAEAADAWVALGRVYDAGWSRLREAEARFARRDRAAARLALESAAATADSLGAAPLRRRVNEVARRARVGVDPVRRRAPDPSELTERERDVLALLADGLTNRQIAERLVLSPKTVGIHVSRILAKLDAHTRGEAVATARRRQTLP